MILVNFTKKNAVFRICGKRELSFIRIVFFYAIFGCSCDFIFMFSYSQLFILPSLISRR